MTDPADTPSGAPTGTADDPAADPRVASVVGKYVVVRLLGKGGMGAVYEARHTELSRRFAVKFLLPEFANQRELLARFEAEAKAAGGIEHPNLVAVIDVGRGGDGAPYLVMEYLDGEDCSHLLRRLGPLPALRAADLVIQACRGVGAAHKAGIVHRDLKPENLFVTDAGDGSDRIKVLDFGIAQIRSPERSRVTRTGATLGTAFYMSPEQARGAHDLDGRTDVWSLGVVLYELLSGRKPFEGEHFLHIIHQILNVEPPRLASLRAGLPPKLVAVVERAMRKKPAERLQTVVALSDALRPFAGWPVRAPQRDDHDAPRSRPRASESKRTIGTPATAPGERPESAMTGPGKTGMTSAKSEHLLAAAPKRPAARARIVAVVVLAVGGTTSGFFILQGRTPALPVARTSSVQALASPDPQLAPVAPRLGPENAPPIVAHPPIPAPQSTDAGFAPAARLSEQSEHTSNKPAVWAPGAGASSRAAAISPASEPLRMPSTLPASSVEAPALPTSRRANAKIDRDNPY